MHAPSAHAVLRHAAAVAAVLVLLAGALVLGTATSGPAEAARSTTRVSDVGESRTVAFTNRKRVRHGARPLRRSPALDRLALAQARRMAADSRLFHNGRLGRKMRRWCVFGENVAYDRTVPRANKGLWRSPGHRANILDRRFDQIGAGVVVDAGGTRWVVQVFRKRC